MLSIGQRIKNLFGFKRPKGAQLVTGPASMPEHRAIYSRPAERRERRIERALAVPTTVTPDTMTPFLLGMALAPREHHHFDPTPAPITPEPFVGGGGKSGGAGASGGWDSSSSSSCDSSSGGGE